MTQTRLRASLTRPGLWVCVGLAVVSAIACRARSDVPVPSQRVLVAAKALAKGEVLTRESVREELVPTHFDSADALTAADLDRFLGAHLTVSVPQGRPLHEYWFSERPNKP